MTFPTVESTSTGQNDSSDTTSHTVTLPSGISAGDLVLVFFGCDAAPGVSWGGTGFTELDEASRSTDVTLAIAYKWATGGETSITVTTGSAERSSYVCFRISGAENPSTQAPEAGTADTGAGTGPNSPSLTPTGGAKDYLWVSVLSADGSETISAFPSNCADNRLSIVGGGTDSCTAATASNDQNAASFDPFGYAKSGSGAYVVNTVAVHPLSAAGPDSAEKRRAASGVWLPLMPGVTPTASKDKEWRQQSGWSYSGIAPDAPPGGVNLGGFHHHRHHNRAA